MTKSGCPSRQVIDKDGGASRDRTDDLIVANDALSQLSYSPTSMNRVAGNGILAAPAHYHQPSDLVTAAFYAGGEKA